MERKPLSFLITITVSGGSGSDTTPANSAIYNAGGYMKQCILVAPQPTATFNFRIANARGHNIYKRTGVVGEISEETQTPMQAGTFTLYLSDCSHDGSYKCEIMFAEVY